MPTVNTVGGQNSAVNNSDYKKELKETLGEEKYAELEVKADKTVGDDLELALQLSSLSTFEFEQLSENNSDIDLINVSTKEGTAELEVKEGLYDKVKNALKKFKENVELTVDEINSVKDFVAAIEGRGGEETTTEDGTVVYGVSVEEYEKIKDSKDIQFETGETEDGVKYAILNGISKDMAIRLQKNLKSGLFNMKNPKKEDFEEALKDLESKDTKSQQDVEDILGYQFIIDNWTEFNKAGGAKKLSKSNIKQLEKLAGDDGFITLADIGVSETKKNNYHRKNVIGTVAAAVVGTAATIFTAGALGPVAAAAIGAAAGSVAGDVIEGKKFGEIIKNATLNAAIGAVSGGLAKGAGNLVGKATAKLGASASNIASKAASAGTRSLSAGMLQDVADDGKLNNMKETLKGAAISTASGAVSAGLSEGMGEFGDTVGGVATEQAVRGATNSILTDAINGKEIDWKAAAAQFAGGAVTGAATEGLNSLADRVIKNDHNKSWIEAGKGASASFMGTAAGEAIESLIEDDEFNTDEVFYTALADAQAAATSRYQDNHQKKLADLKQQYSNASVEDFDAALKHALANNDKEALKYLLNNAENLISQDDPNYNYYLNETLNGINTVGDYKKNTPSYIPPTTLTVESNDIDQDEIDNLLAQLNSEQLVALQSLEAGELTTQSGNYSIKEIQKRLIELGYLAAFNSKGKSNADGIVGPLTTDAARRFQLDQNKKGGDFQGTGTIGPKTINALFPENDYASATNNSSGQPSINQIMGMLSVLAPEKAAELRAKMSTDYIVIDDFNGTDAHGEEVIGAAKDQALDKGMNPLFMNFIEVKADRAGDGAITAQELNEAVKEAEAIAQSSSSGNVVVNMSISDSLDKEWVKSLDYSTTRIKNAYKNSSSVYIDTANVLNNMSNVYIAAGNEGINGYVILAPNTHGISSTDVNNYPKYPQIDDRRQSSVSGTYTWDGMDTDGDGITDHKYSHSGTVGEHFRYNGTSYASPRAGADKAIDYYLAQARRYLGTP